uniref:Serpin domain-containing protein n=1 Tax=Scylla olivacea TaxID=85551 RepID=A0A0P4WEU0_SCYOL
MSFYSGWQRNNSQDKGMVAARVVLMTLVVMLTSVITQISTQCNSNTSGSTCPKQNVSYKAVNDFGFELFKLLAKKENVLISPLSLWSSLVLTFVGAERKTCRQISRMLGAKRKCKALDFLDKIEGSRRKMQNHQKKLIINQKTKVFKEHNFDITSCAVNDLWKRLCTINFTENDEAERKIDAFVRENTHNVLRSITSADQLRNTMLGLEVAGYFESIWRYKFNRVCHDVFYEIPCKKPQYVTMLWLKQFLPVEH